MFETSQEFTFWGRDKDINKLKHLYIVQSYKEQIGIKERS